MNAVENFLSTSIQTTVSKLFSISELHFHPWTWIQCIAESTGGGQLVECVVGAQEDTGISRRPASHYPGYCYWHFFYLTHQYSWMGDVGLIQKDFF